MLMENAANKPQEYLSENAMNILMQAVQMAKERQVQRLAVLRKMLYLSFPSEKLAVDEALSYWANYEAKKVGSI